MVYCSYWIHANYKLWYTLKLNGEQQTIINIAKFIGNGYALLMLEIFQLESAVTSAEVDDNLEHRSNALIVSRAHFIKQLGLVWMPYSFQ